MGDIDESLNNPNEAYLGDACYLVVEVAPEWLLLFFLLDLVGPKAFDLSVAREPTPFLAYKEKGKKKA